jgi:hypothetical protein
MEQFKAVAAFGVWFLGLGYILMWSATGPLYRAAAVDLHPETLSPVLHLIGAAAGVTVAVQVVSAILRGARRSHPGTPPAARWRLRRPEPTVKRIKARDHFGLRGTRH